MLRKLLATGLMISTLACGTAQAGDHTGAILGGFAAGAVGGAILGSALSQPRPAPVYVVPPPPPATVYVRPVVLDPFADQLSRLHGNCSAGDLHACIRFGILIGQHQEHVAEWRRFHPDYFTY